MKQLESIQLGAGGEIISAQIKTIRTIKAEYIYKIMKNSSNYLNQNLMC